MTDALVPGAGKAESNSPLEQLAPQPISAPPQRSPLTPLTVPAFRALKGVRKLACLTAYDAPTAALLDGSGIDLLLVGDSAEMVVYGQATTLTASLESLVRHAKAVRAATSNALVIGDMPYMSYHTTPQEAVHNAARFIVEAGCHAVKLEGGAVRIPMIEALLHAEIPVMGHIGLTPQSVNALGGFKVQGRGKTEAQRVFDDARRLADAGVFALVLECVPRDLAARITEAVPVPTIGIGAGAGCDGQILVLHDLIGLKVPGAKTPRFVRRYADVGEVIAAAAASYVRDVTSGDFPNAEESFSGPVSVAAEEPAPLSLYGGGTGTARTRRRA